MKLIFPAAIDGDLLKLVHLSNDLCMVDAAKPLAVGDVCKAKALIISVINVKEKSSRPTHHRSRLVIPVTWTFFGL